MVWKLDRLGRSLKHLVETVQTFRRRASASQLAGGHGHDHSGGKLVFHFFAALAEFERDIIRERTRAGLGRRGRGGGRGEGRRGGT